MATHAGDVTADLRAVLEEHCPDIAEDVVAAYRAVHTMVEADGPQWQRLSLGQIPGLTELTQAVGPPLQAVAAFLDFVAGVLEVIAKFLLEIPDPLRALIMAAYAALKEIIDDLLGTGCYLYADASGVTSPVVKAIDMDRGHQARSEWRAGDPQDPPLLHPGGFERWAHTFERSFDNPGDPNRPPFSDGATLEAVFVVGAAPDFGSLKPALKLLERLFDVKKFGNAFDEIIDEGLPGFDWPEDPDPDENRLRGQPLSPGWRTWRLRDVGPDDYPLRELEKLPELLKQLLANVDSIVGLIKKLVDAITAKVELLRELANMIRRLVELINALNATGLSVLGVVTTDGVPGLKRQFLEATNRPGTDEDGKEMPGLAVAGVCLLAGTSNLVTAPLWSLLGVDAAMGGALEELHKDFADEAAALEKFAQDSEAIASAVWSGDAHGGAPGLEGLAAGFVETVEELFEEDPQGTGQQTGTDRATAVEATRADRSGLIRRFEQAHAEGQPIDPRVLAEIEATRRARRRGARSLAMRYGVPLAGGADAAGLHPPRGGESAGAPPASGADPEKP